MKYIISLLILFLAGISSIGAQIITEQREKTALDQDTSVLRPPVVDSSLINVSVFYLLGSKSGFYDGNVAICQPSYMTNAMGYYITGNSQRKKNGYRIRLFFDNRQSARMESEEITEAFKEQFPDIAVYRTYSTPYFKVAAGDYRTKSDAIKAFNSVKGLYPKAIIVKEQIEFPAL